jgi:hypothetical protein
MNNYHSKNQLSMFDIVDSSQVEFEESIKKFCEFGKCTQSFIKDKRLYYQNEFWTNQQRQAHSLHEISYRACFKAQLPDFFIRRLTKVGDVVYDPFMGRGTTIVQAALQQRKTIGNDINPLSLMLARPRLRPPSISDVEYRLKQINWQNKIDGSEELLAFYHPNTLNQILILREFLNKNTPIKSDVDPINDWIRMVALNRLTGHSPGFFSVYTLPPNQAVSVTSQIKINNKRNQVPVEKDICEIILKKSRHLLSDPLPSINTHNIMGISPAWDTPYISDETVNLIVTSPPFLDVIQYEDDNWLRCWFAGIDLNSVKISSLRDPIQWKNMVKLCFKEFARIMSPGGYVVFEVGEVKRKNIFLEELVWEAIEGLPFEKHFILINEQNFTKTSNVWGVANNELGTNTNRMIIVQRQ